MELFEVCDCGIMGTLYLVFIGKEITMSGYILTYTKTKFYPMEPIIENIHIQDIAHALSLMTRANGHFQHFYSVAQHCLNCCKEAKALGYSRRIQLGCLLHDASESYISDITRPVKRSLGEYCKIEEKLQKMIYTRYGIGDLSEEEERRIKEIDDTMLYYEFFSLMQEKLYGSKPQIALDHDFSQREFVAVENEFLQVFDLLFEEDKNVVVESNRMPVALFNGTVATTDGMYTVDDIAVEEAKAYIKKHGFISAIGHEATAEIMSEVLGENIPMNRIDFYQQVGQAAIVFKLNKRPPEGTVLTKEELRNIGYRLKIMERLK